MNDPRGVLLDRVVSPSPDHEAWRSLVVDCQQEHGQHAELALAALLARKLARLEPEARDAIMRAVADMLTEAEAKGLVGFLAADSEKAARHLALELVARWPEINLAEPGPAIRGLLSDRRLPEATQLAAAAGLVRFLGDDSAAIEDHLTTLVSGLGKKRSIARLRKLEAIVGKCPLIDSLCEKLEAKLRMTCPRCDVELRRPEMVRHLWEAHRLLLVGLRAREPWLLVEDWIDLWKSGGPAELLGRCRNIAQHLDADLGLRKVNRLILSRGGDDAEARQYLLQEAAERHASVCPSCFGAIPIVPESAPWVLTRREGRLSAHGYLVDATERGLWTRLEVRTASRLLYLGREPGLPLTVRGILFALVGPFVALALACALGEVEWFGSAMAPVVLFLTLAVLMYGGVRWKLRDRPAPRRRVLTYAWTILAPRLHEGKFEADDASFLSALAESAEREEDVEHRAAVFPHLIAVTETALGAGEGTPFHLAALCLRHFADRGAAGVSPEEAVVNFVGRCFEGKLPLAFADCLLRGWQKTWQTAGAEARLRILLCDRAFEAGFEVRQLIDAGETAPALGELLGVDRPRGLAALRLLWSLRPARPWDRCGPALTAFDLAADPGYEGRLAEHPDLLFLQTDRSWPTELDDNVREAPFQIVVRARGVMVQNELYEEPPATVRMKGRMDCTELVVGEKQFRSGGDLEPFADRVEEWIRYFFTEFRPKLAEVLDWKSPEKATLWRAWGAALCPECGQPAFPRVGEMAVGLGGDSTRSR